jgi:hypothetical protein
MIKRSITGHSDPRRSTMASFRRALEDQELAPDRCADDARLAAARSDDTVP